MVTIRVLTVINCNYFGGRVAHDFGLMHTHILPAGFHQPTFTIEMAKRSTNVKAYVFIQFELPQTGTTDIFVTWCSKSFGQCAVGGF